VTVDKRRKSVLIVECDSMKLQQQGLAVGREIYTYIRTLLPRNPIHLVESHTQAKLLEELANVFESRLPFRTIVVVGHSNREGLQLSSDAFVGWEAVGRFLSPFAPRRVLLLACGAGQSYPSNSLFDTVETLDEIFASPIPTRKNQQYVLLGKLLHVLFAKKENRQINQLMQLGNLMLTGGIMYHRSRRELIY
jgi:hypothetical protein